MSYKMQIVQDKIKDAAFLISFSDIYGIVYHKQINGQGFIDANIVYVPTPKNLANRIQIPTRKYYTKRIVQRGTPVPSFDDLPEIKNQVLSRIKHKRGMGHYVAVPLEEIVEVYNAHKAFCNELDSEGDYAEELKKILTLLENAGIPFNVIGVYGGLQVGMREVSGNNYKKMPDIDIVIQGLEYVLYLKKIDENNIVIDEEDHYIYRPIE